MTKARRLSLIGLVVALSFFAALGDSPSEASSQLEQSEENSGQWVVSVRPNESLQPMRVYRNPGRYFARAIQVRYLLMEAYGLRAFQLPREPAWIESDAFDVEIKFDGPAGSEPAPPASRLQSVLAERFGLKVHGGSKMRVNTEVERVLAEPPAPGSRRAAFDPNAPLRPGSSRNSVGEIQGAGMTMEQLARGMAVLLQRPVLDRTGLPGYYDLRLQWAPGPGEIGPFGPVEPSFAPDPDRPSLFTALEEQLGLRLESRTEPTPILVIDHIERPSAN
jgi:uncharacterized protein (TIGR03435 family)